MRGRFSGLLVAWMVAVFVVGFSRPADASLILRITQGSFTTTITDLDADGLVGTIALTSGGWGVLAGGGGHPLLTASLGSPAMDVLSLQANSTSAGSIVVELTQTGWTSGPESGFSLNIGGTFSGPGSYLYELLWDAANNPFAGVVFGTTGGTVGGGFFGSGTSAGPAGDDLYSLTQRVTITHGTAGFSSFDADVTVPEPATTALFALGLLTVAAVRRRRAGR